MFGIIYAAVEADQRGEDIKAAVRTHDEEHPEHRGKRKLDSIAKSSTRYELMDGVLMRRVYDPWDHEVQLRLVTPEGGSNRYDMPGVGMGVLTVRAKVLLEYHNSKLGGHLGVDKTVNRIWKDWYWPGLYDVVDRWCKSCDLCRGEKAHNAVSAWSRTELYSRPFRVLQIDTVTC